MGLADGVNWYLYVQANPIRFHDPEGTQTSPEQYTVRSNPEKVFVENQNARKNWSEATNEVLENKFGKGSLEGNLKAYEEKINSLPDGPQQISKRLNEGSKSGFARRIYDAVRSKFYQREAINPSWSTYTEPQKDLLRAGRAPDPLQQVEHLSDLAKNPKNALNPNDQYFTEGGRKGGIPKASPHGQKNSTTPGSPGQRLRDWQARQAASPNTTPPVATTPKPASGPPVPPSAPPSTGPSEPAKPPTAEPPTAGRGGAVTKGALIVIEKGVLIVQLGQANTHDEAAQEYAKFLIGGIVVRILGPQGTALAVASAAGTYAMVKYREGIDRMLSEGFTRAQTDPAMLQPEKPKNLWNYIFGN